MATTTPIPPHLPNELRGEIAKSLHQREDRSTLLSLALVDKIWRHESQRVLFSSLSNDWYTGLTTTATHILFLESILAHPDRLGPYVHLYAQDSLAINPEAIETSEEEEYQEGMHLWALTSRALPAMVNLKRLFMRAAVSGDAMADYMLSVDCSFQLETFIWKCDEDSHDALIDFLRAQRALIHLEVGDPAEKLDLSWLTPDICTGVTSAACNLKTDSVRLLDVRGGVVALKADTPSNLEYLHKLQNTAPSFLERITYLSVWIWPSSDPFLWPIAPNVSLLEIPIWNLETLEYLSASMFPSLRILALPEGDHILEDLALLAQIPIIAFERLAKLEHIFIRPLNSGMKFGCHLKMSLDRTNKDASFEVDWTLRDCRKGLQWWTIYNM